MENALVVSLHHGHHDVAEDGNGVGGIEPGPFEPLAERAVGEELHHVIRRRGLDVDGEELDDMTIGGEEVELLDLADEQRPVGAALVKT